MCSYALVATSSLGSTNPCNLFHTGLLNPSTLGEMLASFGSIEFLISVQESKNISAKAPGLASLNLACAISLAASLICLISSGIELVNVLPFHKETELPSVKRREGRWIL